MYRNIHLLNFFCDQGLHHFWQFGAQTEPQESRHRDWREVFLKFGASKYRYHQARRCDAKCIPDALMAQTFIKNTNRLRTGLSIGPPGPENPSLHGIVKMPRKNGFSGPGGPILRPVGPIYFL